MRMMMRRRRKVINLVQLVVGAWRRRCMVWILVDWNGLEAVS